MTISADLASFGMCIARDVESAFFHLSHHGQKETVTKVLITVRSTDEKFVRGCAGVDVP